METAAKIWEATTEDGDITITPIIEFLNNIKFLAAAYNQMWVIKKMNLNGENTIAFVDDVTGEKKMILVNPDPLMQQAFDENNFLHERWQTFLPHPSYWHQYNL